MACRGRSNRNSHLQSLRPSVGMGVKTSAIHGCARSQLSHDLLAVMPWDCMLEASFFPGPHPWQLFLTDVAWLQTSSNG
jgi:hypothetical protein